MNVVSLAGNVGQDAEFKDAGDGVLKFRLATSESFKDKDGTRQDRTEWHNCVLFGKRAAALAPHIKKGSCLGVTGRIKYDTYEKDGVKRFNTDIIVDNVSFIGGGKRSESDASPENAKSSVQRPIPF